MTVQELEARISRRPHSPLFAPLATSYLALGRIEDAKQLCYRGLEHHPGYASGHLVMAKCLNVEHDYQGAIDHLSRALNVFPDAEILLRLMSEWESLKNSSRATVSNPTQEIPQIVAEYDHEEVNLGSFSPDEKLHPSPELMDLLPDLDQQMVRKDVDDGRIISRTLAEIYAQQGAYAEAITTYRLLQQTQPASYGELDQRIRLLELKIQEKSSG